MIVINILLTLDLGAKSFLLETPFQKWFGVEESKQVVTKTVSLVKNGWFVCVEVLRPSQPNGVMSSVVSIPNHMFTGQV